MPARRSKRIGEQGPRLPRYRRSSNPPTFLLTARDVRILRYVHRMRFLAREQVQRLEFGPRAFSSCKRRLTLMYHHAYLDRVFVPVGAPYGSSRAIYCLDRRGVELLAFEDGVTVPDLDWRRQAGEKDLFFLSHLMDINDVWVAAVDSCRRRGWQLEWTDERALRRSLSREKISDPGDPTTAVTLIPDGYVRVDARGYPYSFALELDRGTVEERRIRQKVRAYGEWKVSGAYQRRYGDDSLRVLFVVSGRAPRPARLARIKRWCEQEGGRSLFWLAEHERLTAGDLLSNPLWEVAGRRGRYPLIEGVGDARPLPPQRRLPALR